MSVFGECMRLPFFFTVHTLLIFSPKDTLHAIDPTSPPSPRTARLAGVACITFALILHGTALKAGLRLQNALGGFKLLVLLGIALSGVAVLLGVPGFRIENVRRYTWTSSAGLTADALPCRDSPQIT